MTSQDGLTPELVSQRAHGIAPEIVLLLVSGVLLFGGLGVRSLWRSEGRWAEIPREMALTGDYFHPRIGGEDYFDKPLGTYWLRTLAATLTGRLDEFATRLPSAVSGLIVVVGTWWLGKRLWSVQVGRLAAAFLLTGLGFLYWSRTAAADMENAAAIMLAVCWYWYKRDQPGFLAFLVFWLIVFLGALTKGLPAVLFSLFAILPDIVENRRWRDVLRPSNYIAAALAGAVYLAPFLYAASTNAGTYKENGLALVWQENVLRLFKTYDHFGPLYLYFYSIPGFLMPWGPLVVAAVIGLIMEVRPFARAWPRTRRAVPTRRHREGGWAARLRGDAVRFFRYIAAMMRRRLGASTRWACWFCIILFVFLTICRSRRDYYALPMLPFVAWLTAVVMVHIVDDRLKVLRRSAIIVQTVVLILGVAVEVVALWGGRLIEPWIGIAPAPELYRAFLIVGAAAAVVGLGAYLALRTAAPPKARPIWAMIGMAAVLVGGFFCWQQNLMEVYRTDRPFALSLKARIGNISPEDIGFYRYDNGIVHFYLDVPRPVTKLRCSSELREFLAGDRKRVILTQCQFVADARRTVPDLLSRKPDVVEEKKVGISDSQDEKLMAWIITRDGAERTAAQTDASEKAYED